MSSKRRTFSTEFKKQVVALYENGKSRQDIAREYELTASALDRWITQFKQSGSFKEKDNRSSVEQELIDLRKRNKQLEMEVDIFKASRADHGTKIDVIQENRHKYSVLAMCKVLKIARSTFYHDTGIAIQKEQEKLAEEQKLKDKIVVIFEENRKVYGTRKIKDALKKAGLTVSRRRIGRLMDELGIQSKYTKPSYKPMSTPPNEESVRNVLNRAFNVDKEMSVLVSDLTYVRVGGNWNYICFLIDLYNREIVGYSVGEQKDAALVQRAFKSVRYPLQNVKMFHTDRGSEFKNVGIDELLSTFKIKRSLSQKGNPYDNAVAEATFKILKTELINGSHYPTLEQLSLELFDYVNWYNNIRSHSKLGYLSPVAYKILALNKVV
ncbi:IS3 family transposase [Psychrobacillus glaciei]|uniref:IS3 family transposase n=1 Tax=Psychrobacillus glaciei TaxID=2283160 RepID=A0A5J6SSR5_9BACI|nr:IS3 family transposase [Psychrobacillus glaciei]QFF99010.1 IS3 family transposase [Psychrobacillus glaciei]QFF99267.1 IS3 family transposase [Psychrobacillus glaciei]